MLNLDDRLLTIQIHAIRHKIFDHLVCVCFSRFHVIGQILSVAVLLTFPELALLVHLYLFEERSQNSSKDFPNDAKPTARLHNRKQFDLNRRNGSLERHHELETIVHMKILRSPIVHAGHEDDSVATWWFLFQHGIHHMDKIVDNGLPGSFIQKVSGRSHVEHFVAPSGFQAGYWENGLSRIKRIGRAELQNTELPMAHPKNITHLCNNLGLYLRGR
jgi:hypothetical protein